jgi:hypothetical protein
VRRLLEELAVETQLFLRREPRLQVAVHSGEGLSEWFSVWAYFPIHRNRTIVRDVSWQVFR